MTKIFESTIEEFVIELLKSRGNLMQIRTKRAALSSQDGRT